MKKQIVITKKTLFTRLSAVLAVLALAFMFFAPQKNGAAVQAEATQPVDGNYYQADYETRAEAIEAGHDLNEEIMSEGITLLKNADGALPIASGARLSVFGKNSTNIVYGGTGSGSGSSAGRINLQLALTNAGYNVNPTLTSFYQNTAQSGVNRANLGGYNIYTGNRTYETPITSYSQDIKDTYDDYSDAALIVISRGGGESYDLPRTMFWNGSNYTTWSASTPVPGARSATDHYLQLDQNETDLINHVCGSFDNVVIVLNTGSQFETGFLDDPGHYAYNEKITAALWIGFPGTRGLNALGKVLSGEVNPSGRTVDTYARDFKKDPTWQNFANNLKANGNKYTNVSGGSADNFVHYEEGIYAGYRYYETRGYIEGDDDYAYASTAAEGAINGTETLTWDDWYDAHVVYPIGYGLSYTEFTWSDITPTIPEDSALTANDTIEVAVKVTNTGAAAGKDVVQLYYTAPYIDGGIEKSHVVLGAFEKTDLLQPNGEQVLTLTMPVRQMASYDFNDANENSFKGYELDPGDYVIRISKNAHESVEDIDYTVDANIQYETDEKTGTDIENLFDDVSAEITQYMSRSDFAGTFPTMPTGSDTVASDIVAAKLMEWYNGTNVADKPEDPWYAAEAPTTGAENGVVLADLVGLDYDDPLWDDFMDQFNVGTSAAGSGMVYLASYGGWIMTAINSLGIPQALNGDGPSGWGNGRGVAGDQAAYASDTILASTYNKELAYKKGLSIGNEGIFGSGSAGSRYAGWYAPAVNIHRSPFSGRNFEYFSEDGYLTGAMSAQIVKGAQEKGVICFVKHFGLNDQESDRDSVATWASEQAMREIYFKGFELCVKDGGATGIMSALNRVGAVWTGGSYNLLTELLRNEWGFRGVVVTDYVAGRGSFANMNQAIRAGGDLMLAQGERYVNYELSSPTTISALRNAGKNICYALANSLGMNTGAAGDAMGSFASRLLPMATQGGSYTVDIGTIELFNGDDPANIVYEVKAGSTLPAGLNLAADGTLSGTPTEELANYKFWVTATYKDRVKEAQFTINVANPAGSIIYSRENNVLTTAVIGRQYDEDVGGATVYKEDQKAGEVLPTPTYSLKSGSLLPEGLTLSADGRISGVPAKIARNYEFTVLAQAVGLSDREFTFEFDIYYGQDFSTKELALGKFGAAYFDAVSPAVNSAGKAVAYALKTGSRLPGGLSLTNGGYIVGTPSETVSGLAFAVLATADDCVTVEAVYSITITLAFNDFILSYGKAGEVYEGTVDYAQGAAGISYALKEGSSLPEGITLAANGDITGTPVKAGITEFTVVASANGFVGDEITLTLYIANGDASTAPGTDGNTDADSDNDGQPSAEDSGCKNAGFAESLIGFALFISLSGAVVAVKRRKKTRE
ncbi:MAG: glycoside hydrolase family 3 C-terminal domain-containing protein [Clostridiales bacterium]|jgi:beta-glucosidase|nr:glycoside hydrolase family 3 C-terminal domain-containing protein [Clostridiales bacterium]